jgi:hypothetical protein
MPKIRIRKTQGAPNQMAPSYSSLYSKPNFSVGRTLKSVPRDEANIEAEKGETVLMPDKNGLPAHFNIAGNRHTGGGTPLNVPKDSFVFSDTKKMRIKDPELLAEFGKSSGSYTPADIAKRYNINKYRKLLQDPDSDSIEVRTAEKMIENYNLKLAKLALVQESKKGFPQGIPAVAMPYLATFNVEPDQLLPAQPKEEQGPPQMKYGGSLPRAQEGMTLPWGNIPDYSESWKHPEDRDFIAPRPHGSGSERDQSMLSFFGDMDKAASWMIAKGVRSMRGEPASYDANPNQTEPETFGRYLKNHGHPYAGALTEPFLEPSMYLPIGKMIKGANTAGREAWGLGKEAAIAGKEALDMAAVWAKIQAAKGKDAIKYVVENLPDVAKWLANRPATASAVYKVLRETKSGVDTMTDNQGFIPVRQPVPQGVPYANPSIMGYPQVPATGLPTYPTDSLATPRQVRVTPPKTAQADTTGNTRKNKLAELKAKYPGLADSDYEEALKQ